MFRKLRKSINKRVTKAKVKLGLIPPPPKTIMDIAEVEADRAKYMEMDTKKRFIMDRKHDYICRSDKYANNGVIEDDYYFIQDIWGARKVDRKSVV